MSFNLTASRGGGGPGEQAPAGNSPAVLVALVDLGTQHEEYQTEAKWQRKALLVWELPTRKKANGRPHVIDAVVTLSLNEKSKLRKWAETMQGVKIADGAPFDVTRLVGRPCLLSVLHSDKGYAKVEAVTGFPDMGVPPPAATVPPFVCSLDEFVAGKALQDWLPWQYSKAVGQRVSVGDYVRLCRESPRGQAVGLG